MDTKIKVMISLGSSYSAGCIPCFDNYYMLAKEEQIADDDIKEIIAIAKKVRNGSNKGGSKCQTIMVRLSKTISVNYTVICR